MDFNYYQDCYPFCCKDNTDTFYGLPIGVEEELLIEGVQCTIYEQYPDTFHESLVLVIKPGTKWDIIVDIYEVIHNWSLLNLW